MVLNKRENPIQRINDWSKEEVVTVAAAAAEEEEEEAFYSHKGANDIR